MNIYQKINEVRKKVAYVQKDAKVQGYRAVTHDMVTSMVREHLVEQGILIVPSQLEGKMHVAGRTGNGNAIYRYEALYSISFVNSDDPTEVFSINLEAHANDTSDKAPGKACSYAVKYAMLKVFSLETGENEESRIEGDRKERELFERLLEDVQDFVEHNDSLSIFLLSQKVGQEMWTDVHNSAPDGKKGAFKKTLGSMESQGFDILRELNQAILTNDAGKAKENFEDITYNGKRLLNEKLGHDKAKALGQLLEAVK